MDLPAAEDAGRACPAALWVNPAYRDLLARHCWTESERLLAHAVGTELAKPTLGSWRYRTKIVLVGGEGEPSAVFFLKRYLLPPAKARRAALATCPGARSVAGAECTWMRRLAQDGIACAEPAALAERFEDTRETASAVLIASAPGISLEQWFVRDRPAGEPSAARLRAGIKALAALVARFHACGYVHRDLYACHIFMEERVEGCAFRLIDLARVFKPRWLRRRWIVKDLAALHYSCPVSRVTLAQRLRWLRAYRGVRKLGAVERRLVRLIDAKARRIEAHDRRRRVAHDPR